MSTFEQHIVSMFRAAPDAVILDLVKNNLGAVTGAADVVAPHNVSTAETARTAPAPKARRGAPTRRPTAKAAKATAAALGRAKGEKRSPEQIEALEARLLEAIKLSPGQTAEQLADVTRSPTKANALILKKLQKTGMVKTTGQRRGTKYFPV